jgi:hypothetical protein
MAQTDAEAKARTAHADARFYFLPQLLMQSQYGRISPLNDVSEYYNLRGHYNVALFGVSFQLPIFNKVRSAKARESAADALRARHQAELIQSEEGEETIRLQGTISELEKQVKLAELDYEIASRQLTVTKKEVSTASEEAAGGRQMTPEDEASSKVEKRQRMLELLDARLKLHSARVTAMRKAGRLDGWIQQLPVP